MANEHQHEWREIQGTARGQAEGTGILMTVGEYCTCGAITTAWQDATTAEWKREPVSEDEYAVLDSEGNYRGTKFYGEE